MDSTTQPQLGSPLAAAQDLTARSSSASSPMDSVTQPQLGSPLAAAQAAAQARTAADMDSAKRLHARKDAPGTLRRYFSNRNVLTRYLQKNFSDKESHGGLQYETVPAPTTRKRTEVAQSSPRAAVKMVTVVKFPVPEEYLTAFIGYIGGVILGEVQEQEGVTDAVLEVPATASAAAAPQTDGKPASPSKKRKIQKAYSAKSFSSFISAIKHYTAAAKGKFSEEFEMRLTE